jgi:hypothetical protein
LEDVGSKLKMENRFAPFHGTKGWNIKAFIKGVLKAPFVDAPEQLTEPDWVALQPQIQGDPLEGLLRYISKMLIERLTAHENKFFEDALVDQPASEVEGLMQQVEETLTEDTAKEKEEQ